MMVEDAEKVTNRLWILFVICLSPLTSPPLDQLLVVVVLLPHHPSIPATLLAIVYFRNNRRPGVYRLVFLVGLSVCLPNEINFRIEKLLGK